MLPLSDKPLSITAAKVLKSDATSVASMKGLPRYVWNSVYMVLHKMETHQSVLCNALMLEAGFLPTLLQELNAVLKIQTSYSKVIV